MKSCHCFSTFTSLSLTGICDACLNPKPVTFLGVFFIELEGVMRAIHANAGESGEYSPQPYRVDGKSANPDIRVWLKYKLLKPPVPDFENSNVFMLNLKLSLGPGLTIRLKRSPLVVEAKVERVVMPMQVLLEWKAPNAEKVPRLGEYKTLRDFKMAVNEFGDWPNVARVTLAMTAKPTFDFELKAFGGDVFSLPYGDKLKRDFVIDLVYNLFPIPVWDMDWLGEIRHEYSSQRQRCPGCCC